MSDFWMFGLSRAALWLRANGFSWLETDRLLRLQLRSDRGDFREVTDEYKRVAFAQWLVEHGRLTDRLDEHWPFSASSPTDQGPGRAS